MKVLVVIGQCLKVNSSANIAHCAYIQGLIDNGANVDLLTGSDEGQIVDSNIIIPKVDNVYEYSTLSLYERISGLKNKVNNSKVNRTSSQNSKIQHKYGIKQFLKQKIRDLYGIHGQVIVWYRRARKFNVKKKYDLIISLSYPMTSHLLVKVLRKRKQIIGKKWIQIWEDPWSLDLVNTNKNKRTKDEELKLLKAADEIVYVSPITLEYQKKLFHNEKNKMKWYPLPCYMKDNDYKYISSNEKKDIVFGYFGDYMPTVRNLKPFYSVMASKTNCTYICGSPNDLFKSTHNIHIYPRLSLDRLREYEEKTSIIIVLCNLHGGQIPGKIYQYSTSSKIILLILDGSEEEKEKIKNYFEKYERFIFCENTVEDISKTIDYIIEDYSKLIKNAKSIYDFTPKNIVKQILEN